MLFCKFIADLAFRKTAKFMFMARGYFMRLLCR